MTTPQSTQEKAQYFAQYYGQQVLRDGTYLNKVSNVFNLEHESFCLELKPLSSISDEDAIEVAKEEFNFFKECFDISELKVIRELQKISVAAVADGGKTCLAKTEVNNPWKLNLAGIDFLRSKGYALPWRQYSVEQLINLGWLRLTEK